MSVWYVGFRRPTEVELGFNSVNNPRLAFVSMGITESAWRGNRNRYVESRCRRANHSLSDPTMSCIRHWHECQHLAPSFARRLAITFKLNVNLDLGHELLLVLSRPGNWSERRTSWFACTPIARLKPVSSSGRRPPRLSNNDIPCPYHDPI